MTKTPSAERLAPRSRRSTSPDGFAVFASCAAAKAAKPPSDGGRRQRAGEGVHEAARMRRSRPAQRGFATITALTLLALVGVALAAMGTLISADARRTRAAASEAQLRQLLIAGAAASHQRVRALPPDAGEQAWDVSVPPTTGATLVVHLEPDDDPATHRVRVKATIDDGERTAAQVLTYDAESRTLRAADLEP